MRIARAEYWDFGPFSHAVVDFPPDGLTVIEGTIAGGRGWSLSSNGSGKSMILDGIAWALYGRGLRSKFGGDNVVRLGSEGTATVRVTLEGTREVVVERSRVKAKKSTLRLWVDGVEVTAGRISMTEAAIEQAVQADFLTFNNVVMFASRDDVRSFSTATDAERKVILERLLGLEAFKAAHEAAKARVKGLKNDLDETRRSIEKHVDRLAGLHEHQSALLTRAGDVETLRDDMNRQRVRARAERRLLAKLKADRDKVLSELAEVENAQKEIERSYREKVKVWADKNSAALAKVQDRKGDVREADFRLVEAKKALEKLSALEGTTCPRCTQPISKRQADKLSKQAEADYKEAAHKVDAALLDVTYVQAELDEVAADRPTEPEANAESGKTLKQVASHLAERGQRIEWFIRDADKDVKALSSTLLSVEAEQSDVERKIAEAQHGKDVETETQAILTTELELYEWWAEGFGNRGIRSFVIESKVNTINREASRYAARLVGSGATVQLLATKELASGDTREEMVVAVNIPGLSESYESCSKGTKARIDLCILLAFRKVAATRLIAPFRQLFVDELFDGLDRAGVDAVIELLREETSDAGIVLITHDDRIKPEADQRIEVSHNGSATNPIAEVSTM